jgi:hypothetical protein
MNERQIWIFNLVVWVLCQRASTIELSLGTLALAMAWQYFTVAVFLIAFIFGCPIRRSIEIYIDTSQAKTLVTGALRPRWVSTTWYELGSSVVRVKTPQRSV